MKNSNEKSSNKKDTEETRRLALVVRDSNDAITIQDLDGRVTAWNKGATKIYGWTEEEALGMNIRDIVPEEKRIEALDLIRKIIEEEEEVVESFETQRITKDGKTLDIWLTATKLIDDTGKITAIATTERDITDRKRTEETLRNKTKEMETMLRTISHDLRSPLVNIEGFSGELAADCEHLIEMLTNVKTDEETKKEIETLLREHIPDSLNFIHTAIKKMDALLKALSYLAKIGAVKFDVQRLDVNDIVWQIVDVMKFTARKANATIELETLPDCLGDEVQINQVFSNLIGNAIKYLDHERPGRIRISGKIEGNMSQYCVEDNGVGIPDSHKPKVFDIFHRVDPKSPASGDGLGLTTTKQIVERHNGRIWLESEQGKGSKFFVAIPT